MLHERKIESGYGDRVVRRLSTDLKERYPKLGVSPRNLWDMKKFYERFCHSDIKVRQAVALLPWGHILRLLQKVGNDDAAIFLCTLRGCRWRVRCANRLFERLMLFCRCKCRYKFLFGGNSGDNGGGNADVNVGDITDGKKRFDGNGKVVVIRY